MPFLPSEREYRRMEAVSAAADAPNEEYIVEGYAAIYDKPYKLFEDADGNAYYEQITRGAVDQADKTDVIFLYDHAGRVMARTSNGTLSIESDAFGLKVRADLGKSSAGRELYDDIKAGLVSQMSWSFTVRDAEYDRKKRTRVIKSVKKVYDVSAVSIPANSATYIHARSFIDGEIERDRLEQSERRRLLLKIKIKTEV